MAIKFFIASLGIIIITFFIHLYIYYRIFSPFIGMDNSVGMSVLLLLWSFTFFSFLLVRILPHILRKFIELISFIWMGSFFILFIVCVLSLPIHIFVSYSHSSQKILSLFILISGIMTIFYSMFQALRKPSIVHTTIPLPHSIQGNVEQMTAVVLSDIHVSGLIGRKRMEQLVESVNKLNPDFIFITGDLMDGSVKQLHKEIAPLKNLKAKVDIIYITGNHEYYSGPLAWKNHFGNIFGWHVLSNSNKTLKINDLTLNILGIEDKHWLSYEKIPRKHDQRLQKAVDNLRQERKHQENTSALENCLNILLAHQPKDAKYLQPFPWINLQISGHTHGGQIWPFHYIVKRDQKYNKGLYKIKDNQYIYVNQGTGFWGPPMRLGTRSEITLMKFKRM